MTTKNTVCIHAYMLITCDVKIPICFQVKTERQNCSALILSPTATPACPNTLDTITAN